LADPGGICISRSVYDQVRGKNDFEYQYLGEQQARNLPDPIRAYRVLSDEAPPATSFELTDERGQLVLPERPSVVVLPFANISGDPSADPLAEGIRIDIQNALTRVSGVFLVAIASANAYRGKPSKQATENYAVRYALEGNVRKAENRIRVSFTLTDNISSEIVWADQVDRDLEDTFQVFDEITGHVLTALNVKLVAGEPAKIWHKSLKDFRSLEALYAGIFDFYRMTADAVEVARVQFERVAKWNPDVSAGPTWMAVTHWVDFQRGWSAPRDESLRLAKTWAQKAIGLIGCDGQAYTILCHVHLVEKDAQAALELGKEAISIRPNCTAAHSHFANVLHYCGEQDAALHNIQLAMRFSPIQQPIYNEIIARIYRAQEKYDRAIMAADKAIAANPNCLLSRLVLASIGVIRNERAREAQLREEILRIEPDFSVAQFAEGQPYRDRQFLDRWCSELLDAGLPE
jgi:adenylate cyclase